MIIPSVPWNIGPQHTAPNPEYEANCPYCGSAFVMPEYLVCGLAEGEPYPHKCEICHMTFVFEVELTYKLKPKKANCLNGLEHQYIETFARPRSHAKLRCTVCKDEQPLPEGHPYLTEER